MRMNVLDAGFLLMETRTTPMHVAGLHIFQLPPDAPADFLQKLVASFKRPLALRRPFNLKLNRDWSARALPSWSVDHDVDLDYHVRHLALPSPHGERELGVLVSRLHSNLMDRSRPLWECYVIEGLERNRFALYTKVHHALADGVSITRLFMEALSDAPDSAEFLPVWAAREEPAEAGGPEAPARDRLAGWAGAAGSLARQVMARDELALPFGAPNSMLNGRIRAARRFATQQLDLKRLKAVARKHDAKLNDVVLALCSSALRRYLKELNALPEQPLVAGCPVSLRTADDTSAGNAVGYMYVSLATDIADPARRFHAIRDSAAASKARLQGMPRGDLGPYTLLTMAPMSVMVLSGLAGRTRPPFNVTISNVPGSAKPGYLGLARLEAPYPVSIATHGQAVNITCVSYADTVAFGFIGCRDTLPHLQHLAVYTGEALEELESL